MTRPALTPAQRFGRAVAAVYLAGAGCWALLALFLIWSL